MKLKDSIKMSLDDLKNRKFRTFITGISIGIGVMLIMVTGSLGEGLQQWAKNKANSMQNLKTVTILPQKSNEENKSEENEKVKKDSFKKIDEKTLENIKKINGMSSMRVELKSNITGINIGILKGKKVDVIGIDTNYDIFLASSIDSVKTDPKNKGKVTEPLVAGSLINKNDINGVLVGEKYLKKNGIKDYRNIIGQDVELNVEIPGMETFSIKGKISGIISELYDEGKNIIIPMSIVEKIQEFNTNEKDYLNKYGPSMVTVDTKNIDYVKGIFDEVKKLGYEAYAQIDYLKIMEKQMAILKGILMIGGIIVLLVSSIGVINTMTMSVFEKTKSIGIMKALGASKRNIRTIFLVQSGVLGFIGSIVGITMAFITSNLINAIMLNIMKKKGIVDVNTLFITPLWLIGLSICLAVIISMFAGIMPAIRASKLNPIETLSYE